MDEKPNSPPLKEPEPIKRAQLKPADAIGQSWIDRLPPLAQACARLARWDRPVGIWLLFLPCLVGMAFGFLVIHGEYSRTMCLVFAPIFFVGAVAMRGAGCTINDILDRDLDAKVARTQGRPLPAGHISVPGAIVWLVAQCAIGLLVLFALPTFARSMALAAVPLVALYPLMKRITFWPQAFLGLTFNWGFWVGASVILLDDLPDYLLPALLAFAALALWTLGYDTIYALEDKEDDALVGVKSTARLFGKYVGLSVSIIYALSLILGGAALYFALEPTRLLQHPIIFSLPLLLLGVHFRGQIYALTKRGTAPIKIFRSNQTAGYLWVAVYLVPFIWIYFHVA